MFLKHTLGLMRERERRKTMTSDSTGREFRVVETAVPHVAHVEVHHRRRHQREEASARSSGWEELRLIFERLSGDPDVRVVVLSGTGGEDDLGSGKESGGGGECLERSMRDCIDGVLSCPKRKFTFLRFEQALFFSRVVSFCRLERKSES